jgi:glycosyltransferase involved in cell wall biosynthesis
MFSEVSQSAERVFGNKIVIGTISGRTKWGDLLLVKNALKRIAHDYPEVVIACGGYRPPYFEDIEGLNWFSSVKFEAFPGLLRQFDIRLLPLDADDLFNHSKSACGALEAMAAARSVGKRMGGAVPVVSGDLPVYKRVVSHRHNGLVVKDGKWYEAIAELIENITLRKKLSVQGLRWVKKNRDTGEAGDWARAYKAILRQN